MHKLKVEKCFNLAKLGIEFKSGCTCKRECYKCPYYQFVNSNKTEVLLISEDNQIEEKILRHIKTDKVEIKLAKTAEEGRRLSNIFRPAFVLVEKINR